MCCLFVSISLSSFMYVLYSVVEKPVSAVDKSVHRCPRSGECMCSSGLSLCVCLYDFLHDMSTRIEAELKLLSPNLVHMMTLRHAGVTVILGSECQRSRSCS